MSSKPLTDRICSVGVQNPALRVFDIIMNTEFGNPPTTPTLSAGTRKPR
jgi:hypothetical protein